MDKWLCSLPWTAIANDPNGEVRPCCIYKESIKDDDGRPYYLQTTDLKTIFNSTYMKNLRQEFLSGAKPKHCQTCITDESNGYTSKRIIYMKDIDFTKEPDYPEEQQLIISNACNLKCRSCSSSHSNSWQAEMKIMFNDTGYKMPHGQVSDNESVFWQTRKQWMEHIKSLEIVGGEPFYIKKWQVLLEEMINSGVSKNITLNLTTNTSLTNFDLLEKLIKNFKFIYISLSIDGTGSVYEYLRHPGKWSVVEPNILLYYTLNQKFNNNMQIQVCHTIGWLNAIYLAEFHHYVYRNYPNMKIWNNIIHFPDHMALSRMPDRIKPYVVKQLRSFDFKDEYRSDINSIINSIELGIPGDLESMLEIFHRHDRHRNEQIEKSFEKVFHLLHLE